MKKQKKTLLILLLVLIALALALVYVNNKTPEETDTTEITEVAPAILENDINLITGLEINNEFGNTVYTALRGDDGTSITWESEFDNLSLDNSSLTGIGNTLSNFTSDTIENGDISEYGIDKNTYVKATFSDGTENIMYIGSQTLDNSYYYVTVNDDPNVYYVISSTGLKFFSTLDNFTLKSLPTVDITKISDFQISESNGNNFHAAYTGETAAAEEYAAYSTLTLTTVSPFEGYEVYSDKLNEQVLNQLANLQFAELVDPNPTDLSAYALDIPNLTMHIETFDGIEYTLLIGDEYIQDDISYYYAKLENNAAVFLMEKSLLTTFFGIDGFSMIERFIDLESIDNVKNLNVNLYGVDYLFETNHTTEGEGEEAKLVLDPKINGKSIEEDIFKDLYQMVIALSYDNPVEEISTDMVGEKILTITYNREDGTSTFTDYYMYNEGFLGVSKEGANIEFVSNINDINYLKTNLEAEMAKEE